MLCALLIVGQKGLLSDVGEVQELAVRAFSRGDLLTRVELTIIRSTLGGSRDAAYDTRVQDAPQKPRCSGDGHSDAMAGTRDRDRNHGGATIVLMPK